MQSGEKKNFDIFLFSTGCRCRVLCVTVDRQQFVAVTKMASVVLEFKSSAGDFEPQSRPVLIIGQLGNLQQVGWNQIKGKLQPGVSKEVIKNKKLQRGLDLATVSSYMLT